MVYVVLGSNYYLDTSNKLEI